MSILQDKLIKLFYIIQMLSFASIERNTQILLDENLILVVLSN